MLEADLPVSLSRLGLSRRHRSQTGRQPPLDGRKSDSGIETQSRQHTGWLADPRTQGLGPLALITQGVIGDHQGGHGGVGHAPLAVAGGELDLSTATWELSDEWHLIVRLIVLRRPDVSDLRTGEADLGPVDQVVGQIAGWLGEVPDLVAVAADQQ